MSERSPQQLQEIEAIVSRCQAGSSDSFAKLYDLFINPIYKYIFFRVGRGEAEDLTELVFLKTWENIRSYKSGTSSFSSWIFRIAHNIVVDHYRSKRPEEQLDEQFQDFRREANAMDRAHRRFDKDLLTHAMKELNDNYRQIIILKYVNDLSNDEIAAITGRSHAALRILQFRALRSLRQVLERMGFSDQNV